MKTAAVLLSYENVNIIERTVSALHAAEPDVDIYVVDNHTPETESFIAPKLSELLSSGVIQGYALLEENINNNAFLQIGTQSLFNIKAKYDRLLISDGDIEVTGPFLSAMTKIMEEGIYSSCAVRVDIATRPGADPSFPALVIYSAPLLIAKRAGKTHAMRRGGFWMRLYDTATFFNMLDLFDQNGFRVRDGIIDKYFATYQDKNPVVLLDPPANELTHRDFTAAYSSAKVAFDRAVKSAPGRNLFNHDLTAGAVEVLRTKDGAASERQVPPPVRMIPASPEIHTNASDHPLFTERAANIKRARVVESGKQASAYFEQPSRLADIDVVFVIGSPLPRLFFDPRTATWFCPIELADKMPGVTLDHVEIDAGAIKTRKMCRSVAQQLSAICGDQGELVANVVDFAALFAQGARINKRAMGSSNDWDALLPQQDRHSYVHLHRFLEAGTTLDMYSLCSICHSFGFQMVSTHRQNYYLRISLKKTLAG